MLAQPDPLIQDIQNWCQEDVIPCTVLQNPPEALAWSVTLGQSGHQISVYKTSKFDDRIFFQSGITFNEQHRTLVNQTWTALQRDNMSSNLRKTAVMFGASLDFRLNNDEVLGINTFKIHHDSTMSKADFIETFLRVESIHLVMLSELNIQLNVAMQQPNQDNTNTGR